jgi:carboxypeptidase Taq
MKPTSLKDAIQAFYDHQEALKPLKYASNVIGFDGQTIAPKHPDSVDERAKAQTYFAMEMFRRHTDPAYDDLISLLEKHKEQLDKPLQRMVYLERRSLNDLKKIDPKDYAAYSDLLTKAQVIWEQAKANNDFSLFAPYLEKILVFVRKFASLNKTVEGPLYNTLLDQYEEGMTIDKLDQFFATLKARIVPLLKKIQQSKKVIRTNFMNRSFPIHEQWAFAKEVLNLIGYDLKRGALSESVHPFTSEISPSDVRVTTRVYERQFISNLYSTAHEGGHGIYEQFIGEKVKGTLLGGGAAMSIHESQSRFYENVLGRSLAFSKVLFPIIKKRFKTQLKDVTLKEYYEAINEVKTSLIRTESDELTYSLHIMVRYELEKELIAGSLAVNDLPQRWNKLYQDYLGIQSKTYREGCLQDVHWSGGAFGYFPSYALGNAISLQWVQTMKHDLDLDHVMSSQNLIPIRDWFAKHVYAYGKLYPPFELLKKVTHDHLNPEPYCVYLENKFKAIYNIK